MIRNVILWVLSLALAGIFIVAGAWKLSAPALAGFRLVEVGVPSAAALPLAVLLGSLEVFSGVLLLWPVYRRWGALIIGVMLAVFMAYMGARYSTLKGTACGCLPGRSKGLGASFFIEDGLMLAAAIAIFVLARPAAERARGWLLKPAIALAVILAAGIGWAAIERTVLASGSSLTINVMDRSRRTAPMQLAPRSATLIYFYNAQCLDCKKASAEIARLRFSAPLIAVPDTQPETGYEYLDAAGIKNVLVSSDYFDLASRFGVGRVPSLYIVRGGAAQTIIVDFERARFENTLRQNGLIE
jgi:uncharacterized membrane protein YphA (DoxX/SURF4 family)